MAGAVGMTIADLTSGYVTSAPKTFLLKLCIGLIVGLVARCVFHLDREQRPRKRVFGNGSLHSLRHGLQRGGRSRGWVFL